MILHPPGQRHGRSLRELVGSLLREHVAPGRLGLAVALGVVVGCSPLYGLQTVVGLALAAALRLNKLAVFAGSQVSIPPLAPLIAWCSIQLGALLISGTLLPLDPGTLRAGPVCQLLGTFALNWAVGGLLIGIVVGSAAGLVTAMVARRRQRLG